MYYSHFGLNQAKYGISEAEQQDEWRRVRLPGIQRSSIMQGY